MTNYDNEVLNLETEVNNVIGGGNKSLPIKLPFNLSNKVNMYILYGIVPVIIVIGMFFWKPGVIMTEVVDEEGAKSNKLSYLKLVLSTVLISAPFIIGLYAYNYNNEKKI